QEGRGTARQQDGRDRKASRRTAFAGAESARRNVGDAGHADGRFAGEVRTSSVRVARAQGGDRAAVGRGRRALRPPVRLLQRQVVQLQLGILLEEIAHCPVVGEQRDGL